MNEEIRYENALVDKIEFLTLQLRTSVNNEFAEELLEKLSELLDEYVALRKKRVASRSPFRAFFPE